MNIRMCVFILLTQTRSSTFVNFNRNTSGRNRAEITEWWPEAIHGSRTSYEKGKLFLPLLSSENKRKGHRWKKRVHFPYFAIIHTSILFCMNLCQQFKNLIYSILWLFLHGRYINLWTGVQQREKWTLLNLRINRKKPIVEISIRIRRSVVLALICKILYCLVNSWNELQASRVRHAFLTLFEQLTR